MIGITLLCVGKLKEPYYIGACAEYEKRIGGYASIKVVELNEVPAATPGEVAAGLAKEAVMIRKAIPKGAALIVLTPEGELVSSETLAQRIDRLAVSGSGKLCLLIGGSNGIDPSIKKEAVWQLSMSPMTFPHHLARVMVLEQTYRALSILNHGKYHK